MTTYYVRTDGSNGNTGTADTAGGAWADPGYASGQLAAGDICYVKSGTYTLTTATAAIAGGPILFPAGIESYIYGFETTAGDDCPTGNRPVLAAATFVPTYMAQLRGGYQDPQRFMNFDIDGNSKAVVGLDGNGTTNYRYTCSRNVHVYDCDGTAGVQNIRGSRITSSSCAGIGFKNCDVDHCRSSTNGGNGFDQSGEKYQTISCVADNNTGTGFVLTQYEIVRACTAYSNTGAGFQNNYCGVVEDCVAVDNGSWGHRYATSARQDAQLINFATHNNTSGAVQGANETNSIALSASPFVDAPGNDFELNSTTGGGALLRGLGTYIIGQTANNDIGAVQHADPSGGGSTVIVIED